MHVHLGIVAAFLGAAFVAAQTSSGSSTSGSSTSGSQISSSASKSASSTSTLSVTRNGTLILSSMSSSSKQRPSSINISSVPNTSGATPTSIVGSSTRTNGSSSTTSQQQPPPPPPAPPPPPYPPGFVNPLLTGGAMLSKGNLSSPIGEPLNVIVSSKSSPEVVTPEGFLLWATSIQFGVSCLGQGDEQSFQYANLGEGNENVRQGSASGNNGVLRWNYGNPSVGTCQQTIVGGNHMRWYMQDNVEHGTAIFLAVSKELSLSKGHMIDKDGYNAGRDHLLTVALTPGGTSWGGHYYNATIKWVEAGVLLNATSKNINHPEVAVDGKPAQDGRVAVLNITTWTNSTGSNDAMPARHIAPATFVAAIPLMIALLQCN